MASNGGTRPEEYRWLSVEYGTERPCEVARLVEENGTVTLAFRYTDEDGEWFPTWVGPKGRDAARVPRGWRFSEEWLERIAAAPLFEELAV